LRAFIDAAAIEQHHAILEVGVGTGVVARAVGKQVTGLDISPAMLRGAQAAGLDKLVIGDARVLPFQSGRFDRVLARMVWHHLTEGVEEATAECHRVLRPGGLMVLSEGVPPSPSLRGWYAAMFRLKERRLTFLPEDLVRLMRDSGFTELKTWECVLPGMSIARWLDKDASVSRLRRAAIMWMHRLLGKEGKRQYNMVIQGGDVRCDFKFVGVVGMRPDG
jgi:SAM-dependent methyltransferase